MKYPILYKADEQLFTSFGLAVLQNAWDIQIREVLNNEYTLSFNCPFDDKLKSVIDEAFWVKCDQTIFYITKLNYEKDTQGTTKVNFTCEHISFFLRNTYVNSAKYAGETTRYIVNNLLNNFAGAIGRFIIDTNTPNNDNQKFEFRNKNVYQCLKDICDKIGGEIVSTNLPDANGKIKIGVYKPQYNNQYQYTGGGKGSFKRDIQIRDVKNIKSIKKEVDSTNVVTKLHIFGRGGGTFQDFVITYDKNGIPLHPSNYIDLGVGVTYFEDPTATNIRVGYFQFSDVFDKNELYWAGKAKWDELRVPRVNYNIEIVDLRFLEQFRGFDAFEVGDVVTFIDTELGDENNKIDVRVTEYTRFPLEPENNKATFSTVTNNAFYTFADFYKQTQAVKEITNNNQQVKVESFERVYVETSEVIVDVENGDYSGVFVVNGEYNGTIYSGDTKNNPDRAGLFFHKKGENVGGSLDGGFYLYAENGVGFICDWDDGVPKIRYPNGTKSDILTKSNNIDALFDVEITNPQNGQTLKYDSSTQKWKNSF